MRSTLKAIPPWQPTEEDTARETKMTALLDYMADPSTTKEEQSTTWLKYQGLHQQRSPEFVRWFERKLGLVQ